MKVCPKCGAEHEDYMSFCMKDGTPLADSPAENRTEAFVYEEDSASQTTDLPAEQYQDDLSTGVTAEQFSAEPDMQTHQFSVEDESQTEDFYDDNEDYQAEDFEQETVVTSPDPFLEEKAREQNQAAASPVVVRKQVSPAPQKSNMGIILGVLILGGLLLFGATIGFGLWWYLGSGTGDEIASANSDESANVMLDETENTNNDDSSNDNTSGLFGDNSDSNSNSNKDKTPTPTKSPSPTKSPTPSPTATKSPTPSPGDKETPTPADKPTPSPTPPPTPIQNAPPKTIAGGVVNSKATSLPKPTYPAAARNAGAKGTVNVQVLIDENGRVVSAKATNGHPFLRSPAEQAARRARFTPTLLSGQPVKVSGIISYNFQ